MKNLGNATIHKKGFCLDFFKHVLFEGKTEVGKEKKE